MENIKTFCLVVEQQGFAKAARHLKLSTPIVTRRIIKLEQELGVKLLHRTTRQLSLTEKGQLFYERVRTTLEEFEEAKKALTDNKATARGLLRIALPHALSHAHLAPNINKFVEQNPEVNVQLITSTHGLNLLHEHADIVLHYGTVNHFESHLTYKILRNCRNIICASPTYLTKYSFPTEPEQLAQHHCLLHSNNMEERWLLKENGKIKSYKVTGKIRSNSYIDLKKLAIAGAGITYLPDFVVKNEIESGKLISLLKTYQAETASLYAIYLNKQPPSQRLQMLLNFLSALDLGTLNKSY